jgi:transposase InsO family protein
VGLERICRLFGFSRQSFYKHLRATEKTLIEDHIVLKMVLNIKKEHPRMGTRKIYHIIKPDLERSNIKMGRDTLFDLMAANKLLVTKRKRRHITTNSNHVYRKYPNLIKDMEPDGSNQIWVSDITYIRSGQEFLYLFLITDAYSKKILGSKLAKSLDSSHAVNSLQDAIINSCKPISGLVHHSDRGIQYCSREYIRMLKDNNIKISMTENGDPLENPIAERVNGILKDEYLQQYQYLTTLQLQRSIDIYNKERPHLSCDMLTPERAHFSSGKLKRRWKNYYRKTVNLEV